LFLHLSQPGGNVAAAGQQHVQGRARAQCAQQHFHIEHSYSSYYYYYYYYYY
jgi:hypothetical protein